VREREGAKEREKEKGRETGYANTSGVNPKKKGLLMASSDVHLNLEERECW